MKREYFEKYYDKDGAYVEIGVLDKPFLLKHEYVNVKYADIRTKQQIVDEYIADNKNYKEIYEVDYVITGTYAETIGKNCIEGFFSCHMIEHCPDIISHFLQVSECLIESGIYGFTIPDKRLGFDRFRECTPFRDAYDVFLHKDTKRFVLDNAFNFSSGSYDFPIILSALKAFDDYDSLDKTQGIHHIWVFTYLSFLEFLRDCILTKMFPYELVEYYSPEEQEGGTDFSIVLRKNSGIIQNEKLRIKEIYKIQAIIQNIRGTSQDIKIPSGKDVYIYGAGEVGKNFYIFADCLGVKVKGFVISDGFNFPNEPLDIPIYHLSDILPQKQKSYFIVAVANNGEIVRTLTAHNCDYMRLCD